MTDSSLLLASQGVERQQELKLDLLSSCERGVFVRPNVRANRETTAGRQARTGENVPRTARPGLVACRWLSG